MSCTPSQARDEVYQLFTDRWTMATLRNPMPEIRYQGKEKGSIPDGPFVRLSMQQVTSAQSAHTMRDDPGESGTEYETNGLIFAQVFVPANERDAFFKGEVLATFARDIFRNTETPSGIWFRNARFTEVDPDGGKLRWNVVVEYEYNEVSGDMVWQGDNWE